MQDANLRIDIDYLGRARAFDKSVSLEACTDLTNNNSLKKPLFHRPIPPVSCDSLNWSLPDQAGRWISLANFLLEIAMLEPEVQVPGRDFVHASQLSRFGDFKDFS